MPLIRHARASDTPKRAVARNGSCHCPSKVHCCKGRLHTSNPTDQLNGEITFAAIPQLAGAFTPPVTGRLIRWPWREIKRLGLAVVQMSA